MKRFADLYTTLDSTVRTSEKVAAMSDYFRSARPSDAAWAIFLLMGRRIPRPVPTPKLKRWAAEHANVAPWLFQECHDAVGDLAETIALLAGSDSSHRDAREPTNLREFPVHLGDWIEDHLLPLRRLGEADQRGLILDAWRVLARPERFVWTKLLTGALRVGVSRQLVARALAESSGVDLSLISHRIMGDWHPTAEFFLRVIDASASTNDDPGRPYPFFLAHPIEASRGPASLGDPSDWLIEWKWDGIRAQAIIRNQSVALWSRGEELITDRFPELTQVLQSLPQGTVLDGEILAWNRDGDVPAPFGQLQRRITRKTLNPKTLRDYPVVLMAYDLLELGGEDRRAWPLERRRAQLEELLSSRPGRSAIRLSPGLVAATWAEVASLRSQARDRSAEGLMLKRLESPYRVGRTRGDWWKWKVDPLTIDAVLVAAQRGAGKRASLYTDYTFALWHAGALVPVAKAYSGLTDEEILQVDRFIRSNMNEAFGPLRTVAPALVFELGFEAIQRSGRHKSGVALRFPRILRIRHDKPVDQANTLDDLLSLIPEAPPAGPADRPRRVVERQGWLFGDDDGE